MDTLTFVNNCFEAAGLPKAESAASAKLDPPGEYARLLVMLYRYEVDYEISIQAEELSLAVTDPQKLLRPAYMTFNLADLDWWEDFKPWFSEEKAAMASAWQQAFPPPPETGENSDEAYQKWVDARA
jgi:hypothetical protein